MKTTIRAFQREFPRMRKLAAAGQTVIIEAEGQTFEFRARQRGAGILGSMKGSLRVGGLPDGPVIPPEEWAMLKE